jgi:hypothetical protein
MYLFIGLIVIIAAVAVFYALSALVTEKVGWDSPLVRVAEGANVFVALLLLSSTGTFLLGSKLLQQEFHRIPLGILVALGLLAILWPLTGLVPPRTPNVAAGWLSTWHLLILVGNLAYGSVSLLPIIRRALGIAREGEQHIFWLAFIAFPAALVLWLIGFIGVYTISSNRAAAEAKSKQGSRT